MAVTSGRREENDEMKAINRSDKILGAILGAAVGDAMGAATEMRTTEQITALFGGPVRTFVQPPSDTFARGNLPGQVTDDFSMAYFIAWAIARHEGKVTREAVQEGLLEWADHDEYFIPFAGPTTRAAIQRMRGETAGPPESIVNFISQATNGAAMKIFPVGLIHPGQLDRAIEDAVTASLPTHGNHLAISGACAVAAAVSRAMDGNPSVDEIVQAGIYGAEQGEKLGRGAGITVAGPSVVRRLELAVDLASRSRSIEEAMQDIGDIVGSGLHISEAVPAAFGLLAAAKGDTMETIYAGVNIGNDTDTVATIAGAIAGTMNGRQSIPEPYLEEINRMNKMDLVKLAAALEAVIRS
jgi:ADP-ribosylglycohydrolase